MEQKILYKYLDVNGGKAMLSNHILQYTNAAKFNDPFDCHPSLIDFSNVPPELCKVWDEETIKQLRSDKYRRLRERAWVCSLSKVNDSLLMWSYYTNHTGICIGLNMEKVAKYLHVMLGQIVYPEAMEVSYTDIVCKPNYFKEPKDFHHYQLCTKAKAWEHEQEMRLIILDPNNWCMSMSTPYKPKNKKDLIPWNEVRFHPPIGKECFESVYFGINMSEEDKDNIIKIAKDLNPEIKIYQMKANPTAFKLAAEAL